MERYIRVEWPDIQKFQELPEYDDVCYEHESGLVTFVPEYLYYRVTSHEE